MNGIILYKSKYGSTRQYAKWISEETGFALREMGKEAKRELEQADVVVCGGPVLGYSIPVAKWIKKKWALLRNKKVILYTTSGASPESPQLRSIFESSFDPEISHKVHYVPLGGRMIFNELTCFDRTLMRIGQRMQKNPVKRAEMVKDKDTIDRKGIQAIIEYVLPKNTLQTLIPALFLFTPFLYL